VQCFVFLSACFCNNKFGIQTAHPRRCGGVKHHNKEIRGMAEATRLIKKYPNRRLYDTQTSSYITLGDVKQLVLENEGFQVVDAKSGEDLTRSILLQIILEEETAHFHITHVVSNHPVLRQRHARHYGYFP
jgi:polyhydroxyalkanoate synthesis repressor PhaR